MEKNYTSKGFVSTNFKLASAAPFFFSPLCHIVKSLYHLKKIILFGFVLFNSLMFSCLADAEECQSPNVDGKYATNVEAYEAIWCEARKRYKLMQDSSTDTNTIWRNYPIDYQTPCYDSEGNYSSSRPVVWVEHDNYSRYLYKIRRPNYGCTSSLATVVTSIGPLYQKECRLPFSNINSECAAYCPEDKPELDLTTGECFSEKDTKKPDEVCKLNPVIISTGEKLQTEDDLTINSPYPISIQRIYRSNIAKEAQKNRAKQYSSYAASSSPLPNVVMIKHLQPAYYDGIGSGLNQMLFDVAKVGHQSWKFTLLASLSDYDTSVLIRNGDKTVAFDKNGQDKYYARNLNQSTLVKDDSNTVAPWIYTLEDGQELLFSASGSLIKRTNLEGLSHYYTPPIAIKQGSAYTIFDDFSNELKVTKNFFGAIIKIEVSNGITIDYSYDNATGNLTTVKKSIPTNPDILDALTELTKTYHYENDAFPYALTGITDEKGVRYATWVYDAIGRVIQSTHADNADNGTVLYEDNATTVTNALGKKTKYNYATVAGAKRLVSVDGIATASCAAANKAYDYYSNGRIKTQTDWEGNVTYFEYNDKGQVTKRTDAYGKPEALTVETSWHETLNKPVLITYPDKQESFKYNDQGLLINKSITAL